MDQPFQIVFGLGSLFVKDSLGNSAKIATIKQFGVNFSEDDVELTAGAKFPIDQRSGPAKAEGKIKVAAYEPMFGHLVMAGSTLEAGYEALADEEPATIPATPGPYTVTVSHAADFVRHWAVRFAGKAGRPMTRVFTGVPTAGQYSVVEATGVYTFAAADQGKPILISYQHKVTASGQTLVITNAPMGTGTTCSLLGYREDEGKVLGYYFPTARVKGLNAQFEAGKHMEPEHDWKAFAEPGQTVCRLYTA